MTVSKQVRWWQKGIVYQIYPRSFKDTNGDGVGDLQGIINKLDYLDNLGIHAIWISPFYPSPMADFGYDVADYCNVDPLFGDLETFDRLVAAAHERGIKIIIDYVPNHTSDQHPWFLESRSSRDNPKRDWYIWRDAKPDGSPPNNWGSWFGGPAWEWDEHTQQYYLHSFVVEQPDLNWANPEVYKAMTDVLRFWLDRGVDGFRMDVVFLLVKHPELPDNPLKPDFDPDLPEIDIAGRQILMYDRANEGIHDIMRNFRKITDEYGDKVIVGEIWEFELKKWVEYYGKEGESLHLPFNFRLMTLPEWTAELIRLSVDELEAEIPPFAQPNYVLGSHDKTRLATRIGLAQARIAAMLLLTLRGTPTLYNGDELGMQEGVIPLDKIQDPQGINLGPERTRDGCRTPMQWSPGEHAGFSTVEPWLPISEDYSTRNVEVQLKDPRSILSLYKTLITYRNASPALNSGGYQPYDSTPGTYVYLREQGNEKVLVALNFTSEEKTVALPFEGVIKISTHLDHNDEVSDILALRPDEGVVIAVHTNA